MKPYIAVAAMLLGTLLLTSVIQVACGGALAATTAPAATGSQPAASQPQAQLRAIRVAVFDMDVPKDVQLTGAALTDQINVVLSALPKVTVVNRDEMTKIADEHKAALAGVIDAASCVKLGKFLNAQYVVVGRASKIGESNYLVVKLIDVETTTQTTVSAKAPVNSGVEALIGRLADAMTPKIEEIQRPLKPAEDTDAVALAAVAKAAKPLAGKCFILDITETHVNKPLPDPAAQMAVANRLRKLGLDVITPKDAAENWKKALLESGKFGDRKVDYLIEGEGVSAYAAELRGMVSCRARVELRMIAVPGHSVTATDKGIGARMDLVENLAAKAALEEAGIAAIDAVILHLPHP